jgi:hypothetical protein
MHRARKFLFVACFFTFIFAVVNVSVVGAQSILEGKISGTITDDNGEILPGATVEITSPALMGKRSAVTSAKGTYVFLNLPIGKYKLTASMPSFKTVVQENIAVTAGSSVTVNLKLPMGSIEESVTVTAAGPIVDAKTSTIDSKIDREMLAKLPTSRDSFYDLSLTTPGMFDVGKNAKEVPSPTAYGGATTENVFLVNGVDTTDPRGSAWGSMINVNYNTVEEVRVIALGSKAEYGNFSGVAIDVITKSGSNELQGSLSFYSQVGTPRSVKPEAGELGRDWLYLQPGDDYRAYPKSDLELNMTFGGPFISKKLWFYSAFNILNNQNKVLNFEPILKSVGRYADLKITGAPMKNHYAWVAYHYENNRGEGNSWGTLDWDPTMVYNSFTQSHSVSSQWQWFPSTATFLSLKFLGFWVNDKADLPNNAPNHPGYINWWKGIAFDSGVGGAFDPVEEGLTTRTTIQADISHYAENFLGEHDIKFGVQYTRGRAKGVYGNFFGKELINPDTGEDLGFFGFYNTAYPYRWTYDIAYMQNYYGDPGFFMYVTQSYAKPHRTVRTSDSLGFFFDDQWSMGKRLTLNLGLRYDRMTAKFGEGQMLEQPATPHGFRDELKVLRNRKGSQNLFDFNNWSPRVGFTYMLTNDQKTVFRASFGRYYTPIGVEDFGSGGPDLDREYSETLHYYVPWDGLDLNGDGQIFGNEVANAARQLYGSTPFSTTFESHDPSWGLKIHPGLKDQHTDQFSINLEREIFKNFSVGITYIHRLTKNMIVRWPLNQETQQPWEYERKTQIINGQEVSLYSIVLKDYNGDGVVNIDDVLWVNQHQDYEWRNMPDLESKKAQRLFEGLQLTFTKRYSDRWQLMSSLLFNKSSGFAARSKRQDQDFNMEGTNIYNDAWLGGLNQTINNLEGPLPFTPRFEFKVAGNYTIPKIEVDLGFRFRLHTGRPVWALADIRTVDPYASELPSPEILAYAVIDTGQGMSSQIVAQDPNHPNYLPAQKILDLRLEKIFKLGPGKLHVMLDGFNVFNSADVTNAGAKKIEKSGFLIQNIGRVVGLTTPRTFRLGVMYDF